MIPKKKTANMILLIILMQILQILHMYYSAAEGITLAKYLIFKLEGYNFTISDV